MKPPALPGVISLFDGDYNSGYMDEIPPNRGRYSYFACPVNAQPVDSGTGDPVDFNTTSYRCRKNID